MDYWAETLQDDVYMIVSGGWREAAKPRLIIEDKAKKTKEKPDFTVGKMKYKAELIPTAPVIARYFAAEQAAIEKLEAEVAAIEQAMEEMAEEHGGEDGLLEAAKNEKDELTKASVAARLKEIKGDTDAADDRKVLNDYFALIEKEAATSAQVKEAQEALLAKVAAKYGKLTEDEIKTLGADDKWLATLAAAVQGDHLIGLLLRQRPMSLWTVVTAALASGPLGVVLGRSLRERRRLPFAGPRRLLQKLLPLGDGGFEPANRGALPGYDRLQLDDSTSLWGGVGGVGGRSGPGTRGRRRKPLGQRLPSWGRTCRR